MATGCRQNLWRRYLLEAVYRFYYTYYIVLLYLNFWGQCAGCAGSMEERGGPRALMCKWQILKRLKTQATRCSDILLCVHVVNSYRFCQHCQHPEATGASWKILYARYLSMLFPRKKSPGKVRKVHSVVTRCKRLRTLKLVLVGGCGDAFSQPCRFSFWSCLFFATTFAFGRWEMVSIQSSIQRISASADTLQSVPDNCSWVCCIYF